MDQRTQKLLTHTCTRTQYPASPQKDLPCNLIRPQNRVREERGGSLGVRGRDVSRVDDRRLFDKALHTSEQQTTEHRREKKG